MHRVAVALGLLLLPGLATAQCTEATERWIKVSLPLSPDVRADRFFRNLRTDLGERDAAFCAEDLASPPLGTLTVSEDAPHVFLIALEVPGAEAVQRSVDLRAMPADGRTVTLALSACELLRSLWPGDVRPPEPPVATVATMVVLPGVPTAAVPPPSLLDAELAARADGFFAGLTLLGAEARLLGWVRRPLGLAAHLGARASLPLHGVDGTVQCSAFSAGADARWAFFAPDSRVGLELMLGFDVIALYVDGSAQGMARAQRGWLAAVTASLGLHLVIRLAEALWLTAELQGVGAPRGVDITDGGQRIGGLAGFGFGGGAGLRFGL